MVRSVAPLLFVGCVTSFVPLSHDFSGETPSDALPLGIEQLAHAYAFTEHKQIDWDAIADRRGSQLSSAAGPIAVDQVFRGLVTDLPDGHVELWNDDPSRDACPEVAGRLGFLASDLDDGTVMVVAVDPGGPASSAGMASGDRLLRVDGAPIEEAIAAQPMHCVPVGLATRERRRAARVGLLGQSALGAVPRFEVDRDGAVLAFALTPERDPRELRDIVGLTVPDERVHAELYTGDVGYLAIGWEATAQSDRDVRRALHRLWREGARRLVVDLRDNQGGTDQTAANIIGMFTDETWFYDTISMYDRRLGDQRVVSTVYVEPQEVRWDGPVVVLVNGNTVSSGDGMARMFVELGIPVVGFEGTAASFGSGGSSLRFPGGWTLLYPAGRGLDEDGTILLDSDETLQGGVAPTHRIPWTAEHRTAWASDPHGFVVDYAIANLLEAP